MFHFFPDDVVDFVSSQVFRHQPLQPQIENDGFLFPAYGPQNTSLNFSDSSNPPEREKLSSAFLSNTRMSANA